MKNAQPPRRPYLRLDSLVSRLTPNIPCKLNMVRSVAVAGADITTYERHRSAIDPLRHHYPVNGCERMVQPVVRDFGFILTRS